MAVVSELRLVGPEPFNQPITVSVTFAGLSSITCGLVTSCRLPTIDCENLASSVPIYSEGPGLLFVA